MGSVFSAFLHTINVPAEEINDLTDHITRRQFNMMFDSFEAYDVQETRRVSREEGEQLYLIKQIIKKIIIRINFNCSWNIIIINKIHIMSVPPGNTI